MKTNTVPIETLREYLFYDAKTGEFYWLKGPSNSVKAGSRAGSLHTGKYRQIRLCGVRLLIHRVAWAMTYGEWPPAQIDHIHGWEAGDGILNLRLATPQENGFNRKRAYNSTSKFKGISWDKKKKMWRAQATYNQRNVWLGNFADERQAAQAYVEFAQARHGEYFHLPTALAMR